MAEASINIPEYATSAVHEIAKTNGFKQPDLAWSKGMEVGDGFTGQIFRVIVKEANEAGARDPNSKSLNLIVKLPPDQKDYRRIAFRMFEREINMYENILPALKKFQLKTLADPSEAYTAWPLCHYSHYDAERDEAVIIMEDLRELGFKMENKYEVIGLEEAKLIIRTIAKYHATSTAIKHKDPVLFEPMTKLDDVFKDLFPDEVMVTMTKANVEKALRTLQKEGDDVYKEKLNWFSENVIEVAKSVWEAEPLAVPVHGDSWTNNFMFKHAVSRRLRLSFSNRLPPFDSSFPSFPIHRTAIPPTLSSWIGNCPVT